MTTPVLLRLFKQPFVGNIVRVILFPTLPFLECKYPENVKCFVNDQSALLYNAHYDVADIEDVMKYSVSIRSQDMEDLLIKVRETYPDLQIFQDYEDFKNNFIN